MDAASGQDGPRVLPVPVGIAATGTRTERDSLGSVEVPELYDEVVVPERLTRPGPAGTAEEPGSGAGQPGAAGVGTEPGPGAGQPGAAGTGANPGSGAGLQGAGPDGTDPGAPAGRA